METRHRLTVGDSRDLSVFADDAVELVVTSPPYPMVEMWDELFAELDPAVGDRLDAGNGRGAFERMHAQLDAVWRELDRVLVDGGIVCVTVGDATRTIGGSFRVFQNHARIVEAFERLGFEPLPEVLWRKPTNAGAKFMGSGMVPPNAYVTLEHEYILVFRNGSDSRSFDPGADRRYRAAYFWEERNRWFSDVWTDVRGALQTLDRERLRERSGAYPVEIPYRLINMYSVYGDTVLDPFWGTGTTTLAAMLAGRNSAGRELDPEFVELFDERVGAVPDSARAMARRRLNDHREFVRERQAAGDTLAYEAEHYEFPVRTKQERQIQLYTVSDLRADGDGYVLTHEPVTDGN